MTCRKTEPATVASWGVVSVSASYQLGQRWLTRVTWNRIVTRYDRDTDVIEAGVGLRSGHPGALYRLNPPQQHTNIDLRDRRKYWRSG
jgi:hypothetical protein